METPPSPEEQEAVLRQKVTGQQETAAHQLHQEPAADDAQDLQDEITANVFFEESNKKPKASRKHTQTHE